MKPGDVRSSGRVQQGGAGTSPRSYAGRSRVREVNPAALKPSDLLYQAIAVLEERGWCQHISEDAQGRVCLGGSLEAARKNAHEATRAWLEVWRQRQAYRTAMQTLVTAIAPYTIPLYNDAPERSVEDVISMLKRAAYKLERLGD